MTQVIHQATDKFYKLAMSEPRVAKEFMQKHLPPAVLAHMQLETLKLEKTSFVDANFKAQEADIIFSVQMQNDSAYIYTLCEHQSKPDKNIAFRLLGYMVRLMEHHARQHPKAPLPLIYPLVIYSGEAKWTAPEDLFALFGGQAELAREWLFKPYQLIDIHRMSDEELQRYNWCGLMELALRHQNMPNLGAFLEDVMLKLRQISMEGDAGLYLGKIVLHYLTHEMQTEDIDLFVQKAEQYLPTELRGEAMTLAQAFERRGEARGIDKGMEMGFQKGLAQAKTYEQRGIEAGKQQGEAFFLIHILERKFGKLPSQYMQRIQQADPKTLLAWGDKVFDANSLSGIFEN